MKNDHKRERALSPWREKMHEIIFESNTPSGKLFDIGLLIAILLSVAVVMMESVASVASEYGPLLRSLEWFFTVLFTLEYIARILSLRQPKYYITSFLGFIDLLSILPTYLSIVFVGAQALLVVRTIRLIRIFRILKLTRFVGEADVLAAALRASRHKIIVFLVVVVSSVTIMGSIMYLIESSEAGFTNIPVSIYWAIVTLTTVGYGDIAPQTILGQALASVIMVLGYGIIAVPTGIVTAEFTNLKFNKKLNNIACLNCGREGHEIDAVFCKYCGEKL